MPNAAESSGISREATGVIRFIDLPHGAVRPATLHEGADEPMPRGDVFSLDGPVIITIDGRPGPENHPLRGCWPAGWGWIFSTRARCTVPPPRSPSIVA